MMRALDNDLRCLRIHGNLDLKKNLQAFSEFKTNGGGLFLLCSDAVALGPHIQGVDWIVRFDTPLNLGHYLLSVVVQAHRKEASALLLLDDAKILGDDAFRMEFQFVRGDRV
ncbi:P-loop containing nucleoside triphosphate hydrolase [Arabidopsis suecica]|uniref:P-loop containing nucleoside triphosphate hydrolase n=1 Tax=Arabidopsis suecica TaxID=45249 RepID=A0A8T2B8T9_ARASU|nr:P-loop containing nucleoside triphosphate hydrolase [Arabidopsis suecica]